MSSNYPVPYLSPASQVSKYQQVRVRSKELTEKMKKMQKKLSLHLPEDQNRELTQLVAELQGKHIDQVLIEADERGKGDIMRSLREQDELTKNRVQSQIQTHLLPISRRVI